MKHNHKRIVIICIKCDKHFLDYPSRTNKKFCSRECYNKYQRGRTFGPKSPTWKGGQSKHTCKECLRTFLEYKYRKAKFCSRRCLWEYKRGKNGITWKGGKPNCKICGKVIQYTSTYCQNHKHLLWTKEHWAAARKGCKKMRGIMPKNTMGKGKYCNVVRGWFNINDKKMFFRSKWEANYALYLDFLIKQNKIIKWEYEAEVFIFEKIKFGTRSFRPDFKIFNNDGSVEFHEVKGWMDKKSATKLKRMRIYFPQIKLRLVGKEDYQLLKKQVGNLLKFF
jgi:hypothetical protein